MDEDKLTILDRKPDWYTEGLPAAPVVRKPEHVLMLPLTEQTRKTMEAYYAKKERKRKGLRERKPYTRKAGKVHPNKKKATRRRLFKTKWAVNPFGCFIQGYGAHAVDRKLWDLYIQPFWRMYPAADLTIKPHKRVAALRSSPGYRQAYWGMKSFPFTVYSLRVIHKIHGLLFDGEKQRQIDEALTEEGLSCKEDNNDEVGQ